jgi:hypothetical protein
MQLHGRERVHSPRPDRDANGIRWALLGSNGDGELKFAVPAILNPPPGQGKVERADGSAGGCQAAAARC